MHSLGRLNRLRWSAPRNGTLYCGLHQEWFRHYLAPGGASLLACGACLARGGATLDHSPVCNTATFPKPLNVDRARADTRGGIG